MTSVDEKLQAFANVHNFAKRLGFGSAQIHWYFYEAASTYQKGNFLASSLSSVNAIESSIRWIHRYQSAGPYTDLDTGNLNHTLLEATRKLGYQVDVLAFPGEQDFLTRIQTNSKPYVELVRQRHNICHGNVMEYVQRAQDGSEVFTLECMEPIASTLLEVCDRWTLEVERFNAASTT